MSCLQQFTYVPQIFASHTIGGIIGNICTAFFAQASVAGADGITVIPGGWIDHHWIQLGYQVADSSAGFGYSFVVTVCTQRS
jgi:ammonium transporter, Amt family